MDKQKIITYTNKICLTPSTLKPIFKYNKFKSWTQGGLTVFISDDEVDQYNNILRELFSDPIINMSFSVREIEVLVQGIILEIMKLNLNQREAKIEFEIEHLITELNKKMDEWVIVVPIDNLKLVRPRQKIGDVLFFKFTRFRLTKYAHEMRLILEANKNYTGKTELIDTIVGNYKKYHLNSLIGSTCAEVKTRGTMRGAHEAGIKKIDAILSIIKLYNYSNDDFYGRYFGIKGEVIPRGIRSILRKKINMREISSGVETTGYAHEFELDDERLQFMRSNGLGSLINILNKSNKSDFEMRLLNTIYWYSKAYDVPLLKMVEEGDKKPLYENTFFGSADRFLKLMIAMECLLLFRNENKGNNLANRSSYILTEDPKLRIGLQQYMKKAYEIRSEIVHEGSFAVSKAETEHFMDYVQNTIVTLIKRIYIWKIKNNEDLYQWFEKNRLKSRLKG